MARANLLTHLRLAELSLVDEPACKAALVSIFKRGTPAPDPDPAPAGGGTAPVTKEGLKTMDKDQEIARLTALNADLSKGKADAETALAKANTELAAKATEVTKALAAATDEVIKVGEVEVRKSAVGDATFAVVKAQQVEIAKEREARELATFEKRAMAELPHLPGTSIEKAGVLQAMGALAEPVRASMEAALKAGNAALKAVMVEKGSSRAPAGSPDDKLDQLAKAHAVANKVDFATGMVEVLKTDEGRALYRESLPTPRAA